MGPADGPYPPKTTKVDPPQSRILEIPWPQYPSILYTLRIGYVGHGHIVIVDISEHCTGSLKHNIYKAIAPTWLQHLMEDTDRGMCLQGHEDRESLRGLIV